MPPTQTSEPHSSSKPWIAGAVVGPITGFALVGAIVWFLLRRKRKAAQLPQHGSASMAPVDVNSPPVGVEGYTDAKPQFPSAQPTYYDGTGQPGLYAQQGYPQQGAFPPTSHYGFQSAYDATTNPSPGAQAHDTKYEGTGAIAELVGHDNEILGISPGAVPVSELSGVDAKRPEKSVPESTKPQ
jgi:hypothetical protein